ncbi:plasmid replication protein RepC [Bartonella rattaustraliani]|uniref:plasmid replication protein RepC n=1 Tax=Bartonella rattaustraliani TaxID=481139 RepID=UPI0002EC900E|nr:plasmid replication protein RepC [Bartonella rattaustraliani]
MVNKISGRKLSAHHIEYRKLAENAEMGLVSRGELIGLATKLERAGLIKETEAKLLLVLLNTASKDSFEKGGVPIVFKSNFCLGQEICRSEGRVSRLLSRLYDCGLIVMRDSSNFKRYSVKRPGYGIVMACGADLRILVARYHELKQKVDEVIEAQNKHKAALHCFRGLVRQIKASYASIKSTPFTSLLFLRVQKIIDIIGRPAKVSVEKLEKAIRLFEWILRRFFKEKTSKTTYRYVASDIHIEYTIPNLISKCNKLAYEKIEKRKAENTIPSNNNELHQIKPELLTKALPNVAMFMKYGLQSERDLIGATEFLAKMKGISPYAVEDAKKTMGMKKAALAIAITFEKHCKLLIKSPGGYLRGMIAKEHQGELYLERSFYALLKEASEEKINKWNRQKTEKNYQTKTNEQKFSLFKSELNEVLKTLQMPKKSNQFSS